MIGSSTILEMLCFNKALYDDHRLKLKDKGVLLEGSEQGATGFDFVFLVTQNDCGRVFHRSPVACDSTTSCFTIILVLLIKSNGCISNKNIPQVE